MIAQFSRSDFATQFYQTYYLQLMQEILAVMTGESPHETWGTNRPCVSGWVWVAHISMACF